MGSGVYFNQKYAVINLDYEGHAFLFDGAWKLISGQIPFVDFYVYAAPVIGLQALFMLVFGETGMSGVLHASAANALFALLVFGVLRRLGLSAVVAAVYGLATAVTFYPSIGLPQPNQHSYIFAIAAIWMQLMAATGSTRNPGALYALASFSAAVAFLCKPVPAGYYLPLFLFLWLVLPRNRLLAAAAGAAAGLTIAAALFMAPPLAAGASLSDIVFHTLSLPLGIGAGRGMLKLRLLTNVHNLGLAGAVIALGGVIAVPFLLVRRANGFRLVGSVPYAIALANIVIAVHLVGTTHFPPWHTVGPVFLALGALHAALKAAAADDRTGDSISTRAVTALLIALTLLDAYRFNRTANGERGYQVAPRILKEVNVADLLGNEPAFARMRFFTLADTTVRLSEDQVRENATLWRDILLQMRASPGNPILLDISGIYYGIAGKPSPLPVMSVRPGYSTPLAGTPEYGRMRELTGRKLRNERVAYALLSARMLDAPAVSASLTQVACGVERRAGFAVVRFCDPTSPQTLDFVMEASGLAGPVAR